MKPYAKISQNDDEASPEDFTLMMKPYLSFSNQQWCLYLRISHQWRSLAWASHTDDEALPEHLTLMVTPPHLSISQGWWSLTCISHWRCSLTWASHNDDEALPEHLKLLMMSHLTQLFLRLKIGCFSCSLAELFLAPLHSCSVSGI